MARKYLGKRGKTGRWVLQPEIRGAAGIFDLAGRGMPPGVPQRIQVARSWRATGRALATSIEMHDPKMKFAPAKIIGVCKFDQIKVAQSGKGIVVRLGGSHRPLKGHVHVLTGRDGIGTGIAYPAPVTEVREPAEEPRS